MTREEYEKTYIRMMDSLRHDEYKGRRNCDEVECSKCPFSLACKGSGTDTFKAAEYIEIVEQWGKEHPIITNADKFKEVWGHEPKVDMGTGGDICPANISKVCKRFKSPSDCGKCKKEFWESEYVEPSKGITEKGTEE